MTKCPMGYVVGGTGLYCPTTDMAKLAIVYKTEDFLKAKEFLAKNG